MAVRGSFWGIVIIGGIGAFAAFMISVLTGIGETDRDGRVRMPGKKAVTLAAGKYGVYYEERVNTSSNETFEPPDGIRFRVVALDDTRDGKVDLGGLGNQVGTDNFTAESIGSLEIAKRGRYRLVAGPPPQPAAKPSITVGEPGGENFLGGAKLAGYILGGSVVLGVLMSLFGRRRTATADPWA